MAKCLLHKHEDWSSALQSPHEKLDAGIHTCKPSPGRQKQATLRLADQSGELEVQ